ncbi:Tic22 family protein [Coleofasciculus sp. G2-EDA-02]|uniref:Tic22 family protein n=1 Tax=Coleofasciculus sp. G2-EDA-02 TaxID=3069529 RepID=UPI003301D7BA
MKSLVRWSATLGLVGTTLLGSLWGGSLRTLALTEQQVMEKLQSVPVFTVTDGEGSPLVASIPTQSNQNAAVAGVFISQRDAQAFVERLKREKPELGNQVRVVPVSLAEVYQLDQQSQNQPNGLDFAYIPVQQQVQSAQQLLGQGQEFQGVPLFVARGGSDRGYLTIQQENQQVIPFFFDKEQLQNLVNRFKEQQPNLASSVEIQVVPLEGIISTLQTQDNPQLEQILLIPSQESLQFLRQSSSQ